MTGRERILAMLEGRDVDHLPLMPITMMFAADLVGVKYGDYARNGEVLAEAQLRVAEAFGFDYVSAISDPAREAADCGAAIQWFEDQPPAVDESQALLQHPEDLLHLAIPDPLGDGRMHDRVKAISLLKERAGRDRIVEGWVEGPIAEAADLRGINHIMMDFFEQPGFVRDLFDFVIEMELAFAQAQKDAGADLMGVGDAAASLVGPQLYEEFVWPAEKRLVDGLHAMGLNV
nr:uroporphyrinogen decarboxylase family protein [Candidatus Hydrogenedentota bacterium]